MKRNKSLFNPLLLLLMVLPTLHGCEKLEDLIRFKFEDSAEITIPSQNVLPTNFLVLHSPEVSTNSQQAFSNNNTQAKYVKDARLTALKLTITSPENRDFSFLNEIKLYISAPNHDEVLIATKTAIPNEVGNVIYLDPQDINLKPYIQGDSYTIRTEAKIDQLLSQQVNIRADMSFSVTADVF